jgi:hypothetical protein
MFHLKFVGMFMMFRQFQIRCFNISLVIVIRQKVQYRFRTAAMLSITFQKKKKKKEGENFKKFSTQNFETLHEVVLVKHPHQTFAQLTQWYY